MSNNILIVIVIYNKELSSLELIEELCNNDFKVDLFIYDNSNVLGFNLNPEKLNDKVTYYKDSSNPGVSKAYNEAFKHAKSIGKDALIILDQDTSFELSVLSKYIDAYNKYGDDFIYAPVISDDMKTKIYSPSKLKYFVGRAYEFNSFVFTEKHSLSDASVINSGLLIPLKTFEKIGGYNERIKLDFSDIYFIEKYKELNSEIILIDCTLKHSLSGDEGENFCREMKRFPYYCNGAMELSKSINKSTLYSIMRRTLRLMIKYQSIQPALVFIKYYIKRESI